MAMLKEYNLEGKSAVVTGAGRGIGKAIALTLAEAGADVLAAARTDREITQVADEIRQLGRRCVTLPTDVTKAVQVERMVQKAISEFGKIDILVNNAGAPGAKPLVPLPDFRPREADFVPNYDTPMSEKEWHYVIDANLTSTFLCTRAVGPHMIQRRAGKIINVSSVLAGKGRPFRTLYASSKAGVSMFTRCLALEWARYNINVNAIGPAGFPTAFSPHIWGNDELTKQMLQSIPLRRLGQLRELGLLAVYLASDASNYMTGQTIFLDGGTLA